MQVCMHMGPMSFSTITPPFLSLTRYFKKGTYSQHETHRLEVHHNISSPKCIIHSVVNTKPPVQVLI